MFENVHVDRLVECPVSIKDFDCNNEEYKLLVKSIKQHGVLVPLIISPIQERLCHNGKYYVVDGVHRWRAAVDSGIDTVPIIIKQLSDDQIIQFQIVCSQHF